MGITFPTEKETPSSSAQPSQARHLRVEQFWGCQPSYFDVSFSIHTQNHPQKGHSIIHHVFSFVSQACNHLTLNRNLLHHDV